MINNKICRKCGIEKNFSLFRQVKRNKDGLDSMCRTCYNEETRRSYKRHHPTAKGTAIGDKRHRLKNIDGLKRMATCSICGEIEVKKMMPHATDKKIRFICRNASLISARGWDLKILLNRRHSCDICEVVTRTVYDHDHSTGKFRGWLCDHCNKGLGCFKDNVASLKKAAEYVEVHKNTTIIT